MKSIWRALWLALIFFAWLSNADYRTATHPGVTVNVLSFPSASMSLIPAAQKFNALTGASVTIFNTTSMATVSATASNDLALKENHVYDIYLSSAVDALYSLEAINGSLADLTARTLESDMQWNDVLSTTRDLFAQVNRKVYTIPLDASAILMYYRRDLFQLYNKDVPDTWDDYVTLAQFFHNKDLNGDGVLDYGNCFSNTGASVASMHYAVLAPFMQSKGPSQGIYFNLTSSGIANMADNAATRKAFGVLQSLQAYGPGTNMTWSTAVAQSLFAEGRCAMMFSWTNAKRLVANTTRYVHDKFSTAPIPGSSMVLSNTTELVNCSLSICPFGKSNDNNVIINRAVAAGYGGIAGYVNAYTTGSVKNCALDFLAYASHNIDCTSASSTFTPSRQSQFSVYSFSKAGYFVDDIKDYVAVALDSLSSKNMVRDLRIAEATTYHALMVQAISDILVPGNYTIDERVTLLASQIDAFLDTNGRLAVESLYRYNLNWAQRVIREPFYISQAVTIWISLAAMLGLLFSVITAIVVIVFREQSFFKNANIWYLLSLCFGAGLSMIFLQQSTIFRSSEQFTTEKRCRIQNAFSLTAFYFIAVPLLIKSIVVWQKLRTGTFSKHMKSISNQEFFAYMIPVGVIFVASLPFILLGYDGLKHVNVAGSTTYYLVQCNLHTDEVTTTFSIVQWVILIALIGFSYGVSTLTCDKHILAETLAVLNIFVWLLFNLPISSFVFNPDVSQSITGILTVLTYTGTVAVIMWPKYERLVKQWRQRRRQKNPQTEQTTLLPGNPTVRERSDSVDKGPAGLFSTDSPVDTANQSAPFITTSFEKDFAASIYVPWLKFRNETLEEQYKIVELNGVYERCGLFMKMLVPIVFVQGWIEYSVNLLVDTRWLLVRNMALLAFCLAIYLPMKRFKTRFIMEGFLIIYLAVAVNVVFSALYNFFYSLRTIAFELLLLSLGVFVVRRWIALSILCAATQVVQMVLISPALQPSFPTMINYLFSTIAIIAFTIAIVYSVERESRLSFFLLESFLSSERRWRNMMEVSPDAVLTVTSDWIISYANPTAHTMLGLSKLVQNDPKAGSSNSSSSLGASHSRFVTAKGRTLIPKTVIQNKVTEIRSLQMINETPILMPAETDTSTANGSSNGTSNGNGRGAVSEEIELQPLNNGPILKLGTTQSLGSTANTSGNKLDKRAADVAAGLDARKLFPDPRWEPLAEAILKGGQMLPQVEFSFDRGQGHSWVEVNGSPIEWKGRTSALILARDITQRKKMESVRGRFLAAVSHELRTPLNAILGMLEVITDMSVTPEVQGCVDVAARSSRLLLNLINEILDLSKMEADKLTFNYQPFDVRGLVHNAVELLDFQAAHKNLTLEVTVAETVPAELVGDSSRITQIFLNLLSNAIKFTHKGAIRIRVDSRSDSTLPDCEVLRIEVADSGVGIKEADKGTLFQLFGRVDDASVENPTGSGLGLAISKQLCERMGGKISVKSEYGVGSKFSFTVICRSVATFVRAQPLVLASAETVAKLPSDPDHIRPVLSLLPLQRDRSAGTTALTAANSIPIDSMPTGSSLEAGYDLTPTSNHAFASNNADQSPASLSFSSASAQDVTGSVVVSQVRSMTRSPLLILVVEDNQFNVEVVKLMLSKPNIMLDYARNGLEGLQKFEAALKEGERMYDVVLMDCDMPIMNGYDSTRHIRAVEASLGSTRTPIIGMTAFAMEDDKNKCLSAGMDEYMTKPVSKQGLLKTIDQCLAAVDTVITSRPSFELNDLTMEERPSSS